MTKFCWWACTTTVILKIYVWNFTLCSIFSFEIVWTKRNKLNMITAPLTLHLLLMQISSPDFLLYSKPKQEILDRVIKISCCFVLTCDVEHLPRLPWDLFSPEEEDKTHTGEVFNNAGPWKGQRRFQCCVWLPLRDRCRTPLACRVYAHDVSRDAISFLAPRNRHQAPVVRKVDNAIHRINHYPADSVVCFVNTYPLDSDLSGG